MKKIILLISFLTIVLFSYAQGDLQFNQVIRVTNSGSYTLTGSNGNFVITTVTVPANKVWKVESGSIAAINSTTSRWYQAINESLYIDKQLLYSTGSNVNKSDFNSPPVWLASGTYQIIASISVIGGSTPETRQIIVALSGIEFNVIP